MDDLISRTALRKTLFRKSSDCEALSKSGSRRASQYANMMLGLNMAIMELDSAEGIMPVVHARWRHIPDDYGHLYVGQCSNCGCEPPRRVMSFKRWAYCPNCGAKMDPEKGAD